MPYLKFFALPYRTSSELQQFRFGPKVVAGHEFANSLAENENPMVCVSLAVAYLGK